MPRTKKVIGENNPNNTNKNDLKIKKENLTNFISNTLNNMKTKQDNMLRTYNFGRRNNQFIFFPNHKKFYMFDKTTGTAFFEAQFQVVGTFSPKSSTWRFAWANRYVPNDLKKTSIRLKEFGESNDLEIFSHPKVKDEKLSALFTAISMRLSNAKGYYVVPADGKYPEVHLIFTKINKIKRSMNKIKSDFEKGNKTKKNRFQKMINPS